MNMTPTISVIMPVLNGERYIAEAIESICNQTFSRFELLVIDDGSSDRTREIVLSFSGRIDVKYLRHDVNLGIARSINDGLRRASGGFIAFLDHDDLWLSEFLETQLKYLTEHPDVGMVHSDIRTIDDEGKILEYSAAACRHRHQPSGFVFRDLFMHSMICGNSVLIRKECFDRLGLWDEGLRWADYHMWLRVARHYRIDYVPKVLTAYRQHASQDTRGTIDPLVAKPIGVQTLEQLLEEDPRIRAELGDATVRRRLASLYFEVAYRWFELGDFVRARAGTRQALRQSPLNLRYLAAFLGTYLAPTRAKAARATWRRLRRGTALAANGTKS
jgi:glycosyltransferase involved in cell wall biosynthesis